MSKLGNIAVKLMASQQALCIISQKYLYSNILNYNWPLHLPNSGQDVECVSI